MLAVSTVLNWLDYLIIFALVVIAVLLTRKV